MYGRRNLYLYPPINLARKAGRRAVDIICKGVGATRYRPWMLLEEIDIICDLLRTLKPRRCLEWGAGSSTLYFPRFLPPDSHWLAVEHVGDWVGKIAPLIDSPNVSVAHVATNEVARELTSGDGSYQEFRDYVEYPASLGTFDFILVDGRARVPCLFKAQSLLAAGGVIVLHDANRPEYGAGTSPYAHQVSFTGRGEGQLGLWLGSASIPFDQLIDLRPHRAVWLLYRKLGRILRR